jgi:hypothetical protein
MANETKYGKPVHTCPFCDAEIAEAAFPYCEACKVKAPVCPECGEAIPSGVEKCPECGCEIMGY